MATFILRFERVLYNLVGLIRFLNNQTIEYFPSCWQLIFKVAQLQQILFNKYLFSDAICAIL